MIGIDADLDIDFLEGTIEGSFKRGDVDQVSMAVMLETVAQKLRDTVGKVTFVNYYDKGEVHIG